MEKEQSLGFNHAATIAALKALAKHLESMDAPDEAEAEYQKALERAPGDMVLLGNYAFFLQNFRRNFAADRDFYLRALQAHPADAIKDLHGKSVPELESDGSTPCVAGVTPETNHGWLFQIPPPCPRRARWRQSVSPPGANGCRWSSTMTVPVASSTPRFSLACARRPAARFTKSAGPGRKSTRSRSRNTR